MPPWHAAPLLLPTTTSPALSEAVVLQYTRMIVLDLQTYALLRSLHHGLPPALSFRLGATIMPRQRWMAVQMTKDPKFS